MAVQSQAEESSLSCAPGKVSWHRNGQGCSGGLIFKDIYIVCRDKWGITVIVWVANPFCECRAKTSHRAGKNERTSLHISVAYHGGGNHGMRYRFFLFDPVCCEDTGCVDDLSSGRPFFPWERCMSANVVLSYAYPLPPPFFGQIIIGPYVEMYGVASHDAKIFEQTMHSVRTWQIRRIMACVYSLCC